MTILQAFLLGVIQGLTEFIPVSSTAHLLISQKLFDLPSGDAMFAFLVIVQMGTIVSLFAFYWKDLLLLTQATINFRHATPERDLGLFIIIATVPALFAGHLLKDTVKVLFHQPMFEASIRLLIAGILLIVAEFFSRKTRDLTSMTWLDAFIIGLVQVFAVFPGASRSGATISGGMFRGFDRPSAARFSFLMSMPVLVVAGFDEILGLTQMQNLSEFLPLLIVGFVTAAVVGWLAVKWLINYLNKNSLYVFAAYCAVVGVILLIVQVFHA